MKRTDVHPTIPKRAFGRRATSSRAAASAGCGFDGCSKPVQSRLPSTQPDDSHSGTCTQYIYIYIYIYICVCFIAHIFVIISITTKYRCFQYMWNAVKQTSDRYMQRYYIYIYILLFF